MNSILMIVVAIVIILLVFIMFSLDDPEETMAEEETAPGTPSAPAASPGPGSGTQAATAASPPASGPPPVTAAATGGRPGPTGPREAAPRPPRPVGEVPEPGTEEDFRFRQALEDQIAPVTGISRAHPVVAVVQIRFPESLMGDPPALATALAHAEAVLEPARSPFPFRVSVLSQLSQIWLFGLDEDPDDAVFEGVVAAFNAVTRFKKALEGDAVLFEAKARLAVGMATGEVARIARGPLGPVTYAGKAVYLADTLSEAAGDFQVHLDEVMFRAAQPWFDFREWKPMKLRPPLAPVAFYEVVGWNKKEEVFSFATNKEAAARRAVAIAYRYLEFDDIGPLLGLLSDPEERVATEALATLAEIKDERALPILKKILPEAKNAYLRSAVIKALGTLRREEVVPVLLASTKDTSWQIRYHAARALYEIAGLEAMKHLEPLANDEDGAVRAAIREILYRRDQDGRHLAVLRELLGDLSNRARKAAVDALVSIGSKDSLLAVTFSWFDQEPDLQRYILRKLRDQRSPHTYQCFLYLFQHADEASRPAIVTALRRARVGE
ncbi:MAG: hypothetical protein GX442_16085 [Candidatus Riflebacteria bacterium]|nr:hypothetical protein [Candidatus Riflebacteria bacterium]